MPTKTRTIVTERARYTRNSNGEEQLFDLVADYGELDDLKERNRGLRGEKTELMMDALIAADDVAKGGPAVPIGS